MLYRFYKCRLCGWESSVFGLPMQNDKALTEIDVHFKERHPDILHPWGSGRDSEVYVFLEFGDKSHKASSEFISKEQVGKQP